MKSYWIYSALIDGVFILAPAWLITLFMLIYQQDIANIEKLPSWLWAVLIIGVDVAHVYSTVFRTYFDKQEFNARKTLYTLTPFVCWVVGAILYSIDALVFWRAIAYFAVFHFVRQQYGFMMIYARHDYNVPKYFRKLDSYLIYMATLYPLIYWHTHLPRQFDWFVADDFIAIESEWINTMALVIYALLLMAYLIKEIMLFIQHRSINIAKNLLLFGTAFSWWIGIIYFNNDLAFTAINVIAHGIPYIALIWLYEYNDGCLHSEKKLFADITVKQFFSIKLLPVFIASLLLAAYIEEGLWDGFVWTEHSDLFSLFASLPNVTDKATLAWLIPLLSLPQTTHYALDAFIWRLRNDDTGWKATLFYQQKSPTN